MSVHKADNDLKWSAALTAFVWLPILGLGRLGYRVSRREKMGHGRPIKKKIMVLFTAFLLMLGGLTHCRILFQTHLNDALEFGE